MTARNTTSASGQPTRDRLAAEAARMFAERGYHGTSINDLAVAVGIQKSSLYAHISRKADLLADIALAGAATFHAALDSLPDGADAGNGSNWLSGRTWRWWRASSTWPRSGSRNGAT